ncbi:60s ribosomal protein l31 [Mrakia frigida]|uniref:mitochondrial 54S ribosomal protein mL60 MRPL31 n=1 Tax=Mrakia frigida TaxID=29902 RepID=UPI003FCC18CA
MIPSVKRLGGIVWSFNHRMSTAQKSNHRNRLKTVDSVIATVTQSGVQLKALDLCNQLPKEHEMVPKDKYTTFSRTGKHYRKWMHRVPHFTKLTLRTNPEGY